MTQTLPVPALPDPRAEIVALAARMTRAQGPLMRLVHKLGGQVEERIALLPKPVLAQIERTTAAALERGLSLAAHGRHAPDLGPRAAPLLAAVTGAVGGAGGLVTALAEVPVTVTMILSAILRAAEAEGFDTDLPEVRAEALRVLSAGGPLASDDGVNTAFLGARMAMSGGALQKLIAKIVPGFASAITQKLAAQTVPILGAVSGAALNAAFLNYYREMAHVRFALMRLSALHGAEPVRALFEAEAAAPRLRH